MRVGVIGTGYVGLVVGACLADAGNDVICADVDESKIARLKQSEIPIYEPGLEELVVRNQEDQRLRFTTDVAECVREYIKAKRLGVHPLTVSGHTCIYCPFSRNGMCGGVPIPELESGAPA